MPSPEIQKNTNKFGKYNVNSTNNGIPRSYSVDVVTSTLRLRRSAIKSGDRTTPTAYWHNRELITGEIDVYRTSLYSNSTGSHFDHATSTGANSGYVNGTSYFGKIETYTIGSRTGFASVPSSKALDNRMLAKLNAVSFDAGTFLVELGETTSGVASVLTDIVKIAISLKNGKFTQAFRKAGITRKDWTSIRRTYKSASQRWLAVQFGVLPLISDIDALVSLYKAPDALERLFSLTMATSINSNINDELLYDGGRTRTYRTFKVSSRMKITYTISDPKAIADKALGIATPASFYEGIPFSWLVDYVVNVGDFLHALTATRGLSFRHGHRSAKIDGFAKCIRSINDTYANGTKYSDRSYSTAHIQGYRRFPMTSFPSPHLEYVGSELSLTKATNVAALIGVLMKLK